jgi:hypothetical protein
VLDEVDADLRGRDGLREGAGDLDAGGAGEAVFAPPLLADEEGEHAGHSRWIVALGEAAGLADRHGGGEGLAEAGGGGVGRRDDVAEPVGAEIGGIDAAVLVVDDAALEGDVVEAEALVAGVGVVLQGGASGQAVPVLFEEEEVVEAVRPVAGGGVGHGVVDGGAELVLGREGAVWLGGGEFFQEGEGEDGLASCV